MTYRPSPGSRIIMLNAFRMSGPLYVRLFIVPCADDGTPGVEVAGAGYPGGLAVTFADPDADGIMVNTNILPWTTMAAGTLRDIEHFLVADTAAGPWTLGWNGDFDPVLKWRAGLPVYSYPGAFRLGVSR